MGDPPPFDPCECIFSPAAAMRRLISLLRNSQSYCSDDQCFGTPPGLNPSQRADDSTMTMMYMAIAWVVLALVLYMVRPQSLRDGDSKPTRRSDNDFNNDDGNNPEPPSPVM